MVLEKESHFYFVTLPPEPTGGELEENIRRNLGLPRSDMPTAADEIDWHEIAAVLAADDPQSIEPERMDTVLRTLSGQVQPEPSDSETGRWKNFRELQQHASSYSWDDPHVVASDLEKHPVMRRWGLVRLFRGSMKSKKNRSSANS